MRVSRFWYVNIQGHEWIGWACYPTSINQWLISSGGKHDMCTVLVIVTTHFSFLWSSVVETCHRKLEEEFQSQSLAWPLNQWSWLYYLAKMVHTAAMRQQALTNFDLWLWCDKPQYPHSLSLPALCLLLPVWRRAFCWSAQSSVFPKPVKRTTSMRNLTKFPLVNSYIWVYISTLNIP